MSERSALADALAAPGAWTTVYVDGPGDEPQTIEESKQDALLRSLDEAGTPEKHCEVIAEALRAPTGVPSPSTRYLLVRDGEIIIDEKFAEPRHGPELLKHKVTPVVLPLLRHHSYAPRYVVVETTRDGADIRLERAGRADPEQESTVEGSTDALPKVQAGGLSQARWQRHSEEVWKHNQSEVAEALKRVIRDTRPAFIVLAGDQRARQLLREQLSNDETDLLVEVDVNTRADGADQGAVERAILEELAAGQTRGLDAALDAAHAGDGDRRAEGIAEVVHALQQAQVEELLIDARLIDPPSEATTETLGLLDAEPWIWDGTGLTGDVNEIERAPVAEALAHAAVLTGARVRILEDEPEQDDEAREQRPPRPPLALLRW